MQQTFFGRLFSMGIWIGPQPSGPTSSAPHPGRRWGYCPKSSWQPPRFAGLWRRSPAVSAVFSSTHIRLMLAAAARHSQNGIVPGCLHGGCQRATPERLWICRSDRRPARGLLSEHTETISVTIRVRLGDSSTCLCCFVVGLHVYRKTEDRYLRHRRR